MLDIGFSWPEGANGAFTSSWDDGTEHDRRLVSIMNAHGLKGTFNLNSGPLGYTAAQSGWKNYVTSEEVATLYAGHEIAAHSVTHPFLQHLPDEVVLAQVIEDRRRLEALTGYPVRGMALPYTGSCDARITELIRRAGILYLRSFDGEPAYAPPGDFMVFRTTGHYKQEFDERWAKFVANKQPDKLYYLWGHSYEFDNDGNWDLMERIAQRVSSEAGLWHATNMQIFDYVSAWRGLRFSVDCALVANPSATTVWYRHRTTLGSIPAGVTMRLSS